MKRTLVLKREALAELDADDLTAVVGGQAPSGLTCPVPYCFSGAICDLTESCFLY